MLLSWGACNSENLGKLGISWNSVTREISENSTFSKEKSMVDNSLCFLSRTNKFVLLLFEQYKIKLK